MIVIPSSVVPPRGGIEPIERKKLKRLARKVGQSRVTSVCAPAGFGKTAAIRCWVESLAEEGRPTMWIAGRSGFSNLSQFLATLRAAGQGAGYDWPDASQEEFLPLMLRDISTSGGPSPVLIVEDTQFLPADVIAFLAHMIGNARDSMTTILSTRGQSGVPLARLRSLGYLVEVGVRELRFSYEETASLIAALAEEPVDFDWVQAVVDHMAGWPAGILMAARLPAPRGSNEERNEARLLSLRQQVKEYFDEEVIAGLDPDMRQFLLDISILDGVDRDAAMAITTCGDSGTRLETALRQGLFVDIIDDRRGRYRLHPQFRAMLHNRLKDKASEHASVLHQRAATHYLSRRDLLKAVELADASGDLEFLAGTLNEVAEELTYQGDMATVVRLAEQLPWPILSRQPGILLCLAWRKIRSLSFKTAEDLLAAAEEQIDRMRSSGRDEAPLAAHFERLLRHRQVMLLAAKDDMPQVEKLSEELLAEFSDDSGYLSCTLLAQLMAARRELFHFHDVLKLEAETRRALSQPRSDFASIALKASIAPTLAMQGKTQTARQLLEQSLAMAETYAGAGSGLAALPALPLAELCYDMDELDLARDLVDRHLGVAREFGYADQLGAGHLVRARLFAAQGEMAKALAALDEAHLVALECGLERLRSFAVALQVKWLLQDGQPEAALRAFVAGGFDPDQEPVPTMNPSRCQEAVAAAWIRLESHQHRLVRARKVARRWQELVKRCGATRSVVLFDLLLAEIGVLSGENGEARRHIRSAVAAACEPGWSRIFMDEGEAVKALLQEAYGDSPLIDSGPDAFAARLLRGAGGALSIGDEEDGEGGLGGRLSSRELEVLALVAGGLRNREIGFRLGLTEGTVKWYMQQIYDKLGVRRRPQAVTRARSLGLLR